MLIKNGKVHDGLGKVRNVDIRITDGIISELGRSLRAKNKEEVFDAKGMEVFPGFIQAVSSWGVNGSWTEIRPSSQDNDERSEPITPELDAFYAFNGRAITAQQLGAFGITACGVEPTDNNLFGGQIAAFTVDGVNPYKMCLRRGIGMKASVRTDMKKVYGARSMAPQTRMWIFGTLEEQLRKAKEYLEKQEAAEKAKAEADQKFKSVKAAATKPSKKIKAASAETQAGEPDATAQPTALPPEVPRDQKLEAIGKVITGELPLFISCDSLLAIERVRDIIKPYKAIQLVLINGYGLTGNETWLIRKKIPLVVKSAAELMTEEPKGLDYNAIAKLSEKGVSVSLSGSLGWLGSREDMLWNAADMMRVMHDAEKILPMLTNNPAKLLGIDDVTGSIEVGKRADIVIWSDNPIKTWKAKVVRTLLAGETIYKEGDEMKCM
ncbi:MAG: amidohydrolase family protein [Firmicutes bacterium]|nr:amidohydrolase family protein [Bacillota bacterium]